MDLVDNITPLDPDELDDYVIFACGGGAGGMLQAGYCTALAQQGVIENAVMFGGTSAGGLNAGVFGIYGASLPAANTSDVSLSVELFPGDKVNTSPLGPPPKPYLDGAAVWENIRKNTDVYNGSVDSIWGKLGAGLGFIFGAESILDPTPLHNKLDNIFGDLTLEDASKIFGINISITATDLNTMTVVFFTSFNPETKHYKLATVLKATSAIPGVFKSIPIQMPNGETHWFVDGGTVANNPFVAYTNYNNVFQKKAVKKAIILYCYPDAFVDDGLHMTGPDTNKKYKSYRDALLRTIPTMLNGQEQVAEMFIQDMVRHSGWEVVAYFPQKKPCDPLDFTHWDLVQKGYNQVVSGNVYSYNEDAEINILDFLRKK